MSTPLKSLAYTLLAASLMSIQPAAAVPLSPVIATVATTSDATTRLNVEQVQFTRNRGIRGGNYRRGGGGGGGIALGIGAAIIGGIVLSQAARAEHRHSHGSEWERCERTFRSFEPSTGLYTGYDGVRRTCPYLR